MGNSDYLKIISQNASAIGLIGVTVATGDTITYRRWSELIKENFEKHFYIDTNPSAPDPRRDLVSRRGIYKDCVGATQPWTDYQLRCNFPIALTVVCNNSTSKNIRALKALIFSTH